MGAQLGKYRLLKRLAAGGMGEIWLARQQGLAGFDRLAVVKQILPHLARSRKFLEMFLDEARLAAQLSHPHIVQIYDLGKTTETFYIAMEYIHGENLRVVNRGASRRPSKSMPPAFVARVISQACEALHYAHTRTDESGQALGIVHRDVSPQNLLLSYEGQIKVVDFGIAKAVGRMTETKTGDLKGKTVYMSPEQIRGGMIDRRSDVFSLGIVLWELATGTRLYNQESDFLVMQAICDEAPPRPREIHRTVPGDLEDIILRALEKDPRDRFQTASEMHLALERFLQSSSQIVASTHLADYMRDLFPDRVERFSLLEGAEEAPDSKVLAGMSALFEEPVSASGAAAPVSKDRHTLPLPDDEAPKAGTRAAPGAPPPLPPKRKTARKEGRAARPSAEAEALAPPAHGSPRPVARGEPPRPAAGHAGQAAPSERDSTPVEEGGGAGDDDIDLSQVVDPYADKEAVREADSEKSAPVAEDHEGGPSGGVSEVAPSPARRSEATPAGGGPLERARRAVARGWYSLPGRGRLTTGTSRLIRGAGLVGLLLCSAWIWDWTGRTLMPPLDGGMATQVVALVKERMEPPPRMVVHIVSHPPGATVVIDGDVAGRTPFTEQLARKSTVEIELHSPGYQVWQRRFASVEDSLEVEAFLRRR